MTQPAQAVDELYRAHALGLVRFALMLVGDQTTAEDVVQEAFLSLYRGWHRVRDPGSMPGYLRTAVLNGCRPVGPAGRVAGAAGSRGRGGGAGPRRPGRHPAADRAVSGLAGVLPTAVALSADGRTGAFSTVRCAGEAAGQAGGTRAVGGVSLVDMTSGHVTRQWSYVLGDDYSHDLSLSADGSTLAFSMILDNSLVTGVRTLATRTPSGTVDAASRVVLHQPRARYAGVGPAQLSPDGKTLYACSTASPVWQQVTLTLAGYDSASGQRARVLRTWPPSYDLSCALAMDPSGRYLLLLLSGRPGSTWVKPKAGTIGGRPPVTRLIAINLASGAFRTLPATISGPAFSGVLAW